MRIESLFTLCALAVCAPANADSDNLDNAERAHSLEVGAAAAIVTISESGNDRASLRLPALEFVFRIQPACAAPFRAGSISLTVADSRRTLNAEQLQDETAASELRLTVPASQIAPVPVSGFCSAEPNPDDDANDSHAQRGESLTLPATLSANASLLCVTESEQQIVYTTAPLDVTLICGPDGETAE